MSKLYTVHLTNHDREDLEQVLLDNDLSHRHRQRAEILLAADQGDTDTEIASTLGGCVVTVERIRQRFSLEGLQPALGERPRPGAKPKMTGQAHALVVALACSQAPEGHTHWTMRMLANRLVELAVVETVSHETIRQTLKKTTASPGRNAHGACPR